MFRNRSFKNIKSRAGVTLTELIVGMILLSIFVLTVGALLTNVTRLQRRVIEMTELSALLDSVANPIVRELTNASHSPPVILGEDPDGLVFCDIDEDSPGFCGCDLDCTNEVDGCSSDDCPFNCAGSGENRFTMHIGARRVTYTVDDEGILMRSCDSRSCIDNCEAFGCTDDDCDGHPDCFFREHAVFSKEFYKFRSISFVLEPAPVTGHAYILTITITNDQRNDEILTSRNYAIRPLAMN
jgi:hypothetical protein